MLRILIKNILILFYSIQRTIIVSLTVSDQVVCCSWTSGQPCTYVQSHQVHECIPWWGILIKGFRLYMKFFCMGNRPYSKQCIANLFEKVGTYRICKYREKSHKSIKYELL